MKRLLLSVCIPALTSSDSPSSTRGRDAQRPGLHERRGRGHLPQRKDQRRYAQYFQRHQLSPGIVHRSVAIANVTFEPAAATSGTSTAKAADSPRDRRTRLVPAVGKARAGAQARRRGEHSGRGQTLARRGQGQLVFPSCRGCSGGRGFRTNGWNKYLTKNTSNSSKGAHHVTLGI